MSIFIDIVILIVIMVTCYFAHKKGFLLSLYKVISLFLSIFLAWLFNPVMKNVLLKYTQLKQWFENLLDDRIKKVITDSIELGTAAEKEEAMGTLNIPNALKESLIKQFEESNLESTFANFITESLADICVGIVSFLLVLVLVLILMLIIKGILKLISIIPIVGDINRALGIVFGVLLALVRVWLVLFIVGFFIAGSSEGYMIETINNSFICKWLYNNNLISYIVLKLLIK